MMIENCNVQLTVSREPEPQDIEMVLLSPVEWDNPQRPRPDKLLSHIANVVNHGGLCGAANTPVYSSLLLQEPEPASGRVMKRRFRIQGVDPGAWRVILGSCIGAAVRTFPLERLELASVNEDLTKSLNVEEAFHIAYPKHPKQLPFTLERSVTGHPTKDRLINFGFMSPLEDEIVQEVISALLSWDELLWGGYPLEGQPPMENVTDAIEAYLVDPVTVEHPLPNYVGSDYAFDSAICMALWFHSRRAPVEHVTID
jgi:hypothetical protein